MKLLYLLENIFAKEARERESKGGGRVLFPSLPPHALKGEAMC